MQIACGDCGRCLLDARHATTIREVVNLIDRHFRGNLQTICKVWVTPEWLASNGDVGEPKSIKDAMKIKGIRIEVVE